MAASLRLGPAVALVALGTALAGCSLSIGGERTEQRAEADAVVADGELTVELDDPPTRSEVALPEGRRTVILQRDGGEPIGLSVVFRDGRRWSTDARWVSVTAPRPTADPTSLVARGEGRTFAELRRAVEEGVAELGVDRARADAVLLASSHAMDGDADVMRALPTTVGNGELVIRTIARATRDEYAVNYLLRWRS